MKKTIIFFLALLGMLFCSCGVPRGEEESRINAAEYGVLPENTPAENTKNLQELIDSLFEDGGVIYIPEGVYRFAEGARQTIGSHCIRMRSGVSIVGDGEATVLMPVGDSAAGLDMFYFNDYLDTGSPVYLVGCRFEDFVIDGKETTTAGYTSAGKGFMFNLFRDCHWRRVTVRNTDATGFGVDCPVDSSITDCLAVNCGKAAKDDSSGASGFGIGFGYSDGESITVSDCRAVGNKKFGFFFEHQGRFNAAKYTAAAGDFRVTGCTAEGNLYNFGGISAANTTYTDCHSQAALKYGYYFEDSTYSSVTGSTSESEGEAAFTLLSTGTGRPYPETRGVRFTDSSAELTPCGVLLVNRGEPSCMSDNEVSGCKLLATSDIAVAEGRVGSHTFKNNTAEGGVLRVDSVEELTDISNSWNNQKLGESN